MRRLLHAFFYGVVFLFFLQLVTAFVGALYAFGLLNTAIPPEIVVVLLLLAPLFLLFFPRQLPRWFLPLTFLLFLALRAGVVSLQTRGVMLGAGVGVAAFFLFLPALLAREAECLAVSWSLGAGVTLALGLTALFRAAGSGVDVTMNGPWLPVGWALAFLALLLYPLVFRRTRATPGLAPDKQGSWWQAVAYAVGAMGGFILLYFAFAAPNVMARWTEASYLLVLGLEAMALVLFAGLLAGWLPAPSAPARLLLTALFVATLVGTILVQQVRFPAAAAAYPFAPSPPTWLAQLLLAATLLLLPILLFDLTLYLRALLELRPSPRALGIGFAAGALCLLVLIFAHVFTTTYDYIPLIGPFFRDRFWLVYLVAGLLLLLPLFLLRRDVAPAADRARMPVTFLFLVLLLGAAGVAFAYARMARPAPVARAEPLLRVATYNIQQGYSEAGQASIADQVTLLAGLDADIIGVQESDTNRIAGGNDDLVRYAADRLGMYSYYGPSPVVGTFGIALLSRFPLQNPRTFYMASEGEQTATIHATVSVGGSSFNVLVTHLGNGGPRQQQEAILQETAGMERVVLMGDFNFRPASPPYAETVKILDDAWVAAGSTPAAGIDPDERVDHLFISPALSAEDAFYITSPASDHPALVGIVTAAEE